MPQEGCMPRSKALIKVSMYVVLVGEVLEYCAQYVKDTQMGKMQWVPIELG